MIGVQLIAIDNCVMEDDDQKQPTLRTGKIYNVKAIRQYIDHDSIVIIDEDEEDHEFKLNEINKFFRLYKN
jgi:hypothetical protein